MFNLARQHCKEMITAKEAISLIIEEKKKNNKEPSIAHFTEIQSAVIQSLKAEINELCKDGEINKHKTLNGVAFSLKE